MRPGQVSQTALQVATTMVTLAQQPAWRQKLPPQLPELSERLVLAARQPPYSRQLLQLSKRRWAVGLAKLGERAQPGIFEGLGNRKIFIDQQVSAAINAGASQVLVLGAGFDTLCLRLAPAYPDVTFFEIDHPDTARAKRAGVEREGVPANMRLIAADLARKPLASVLDKSSGWRRTARSSAVAEGLLYYLAPAAVRDLFDALFKITGPGSRVSFSHIVSFRHLQMARLAIDLAGEPWLSASRVDDFPAYLGPGWEPIATAAGKRRDLEGFATVEKTS